MLGSALNTQIKVFLKNELSTHGQILDNRTKFGLSFQLSDVLIFAKQYIEKNRQSPISFHAF